MLVLSYELTICVSCGQEYLARKSAMWKMVRYLRLEASLEKVLNFSANLGMLWMDLQTSHVKPMEAGQLGLDNAGTMVEVSWYLVSALACGICFRLSASSSLNNRTGFENWYWKFVFIELI